MLSLEPERRPTAAELVTHPVLLGKFADDPVMLRFYVQCAGCVFGVCGCVCVCCACVVYVCVVADFGYSVP